MTTHTFLTVEPDYQGRVAIVTLRRPRVHNAFNAQMIAELTEAFRALSMDESLHAIVLTGEGSSFCAGADITWMQESVAFTEEQNREDAQRLATLLQTLQDCPCPIVARMHGSALGGGVGLLAVCDLVIAAEQARFALSEVKLGLAPAVISPYVIRKIGESHARVLFITGERFSATRALSLGLLHAVVPLEQLDDAIQNALHELLTSAPQALRVCKQLALQVGHMDAAQALAYTTETIARLRVGAEGQEGLHAFLEKRQPDWVR
ncbi:MAG TPA: enoyl-CoA hydratase/isomerase family protein [Ktedonobacteraceae bacterium]|jgi:methylglutaconyl-CoA hydratase|nr:enoyl-CoA hydratase/isomerase family protein [Ktedonobacteraceae bacterium]